MLELPPQSMKLLPPPHRAVLTRVLTTEARAIAKRGMVKLIIMVVRSGGHTLYGVSDEETVIEKGQGCCIELQWSFKPCLIYRTLSRTRVEPGKQF
jgi:hypothetical protein